MFSSSSPLDDSEIEPGRVWESGSATGLSEAFWGEGGGVASEPGTGAPALNSSLLLHLLLLVLTMSRSEFH